MVSGTIENASGIDGWSPKIRREFASTEKGAVDAVTGEAI
jgi:hypothetical protein